jgi:hypothetical protein
MQSAGETAIAYRDGCLTVGDPKSVCVETVAGLEGGAPSRRTINYRRELFDPPFNPLARWRMSWKRICCVAKTNSHSQ